MSSTDLLYSLIVLFVGNKPLIASRPYFKNSFLLCMGLHIYVVNVRPSSLQSAVLVDFINHFHVIYFPGTFGFYFLYSWTIVFVCW